ncbi:MAG: EscN/YscN/HrcN family type III secretion system ATPase, partial [Longimicrobiales bacterium]
MIDVMASRIASVPRFVAFGRTTRVVGLVVEATGMDVALGELCRISATSAQHTVLAEVVGFHERGVLLMPLGRLEG